MGPLPVGDLVSALYVFNLAALAPLSHCPLHVCTSPPPANPARGGSHYGLLLLRQLLRKLPGFSPPIRARDSVGESLLCWSLRVVRKP